MGSWPILVIVEREISYAVHAHPGGEDTYYSPMTAASAGTPSVWTAWLWPAVSSRRPRHGGGTPGVTSSHASPRLGLGRHWRWVGLGWLPWAGGLGLVPTGRPQEAAAQEIEVRTAKHLAFHHFQPVAGPRASWPSRAAARYRGAPAGAGARGGQSPARGRSPPPPRDAAPGAGRVAALRSRCAWPHAAAPAMSPGAASRAGRPAPPPPAGPGAGPGGGVGCPGPDGCG